MVYLITAFLVSFVLTVLLIRFKNAYGSLTADSDLTSVQKYHVRPVPRVGGAALIVAVLATCLVVAWREPDVLVPILLVWVCALPAFLCGLAEDLTKKLSVKVRLFFMAASGVLVYFVLDAQVTRLNIFGVDWLLGFAAVSFVVTVVVIAGAANAINIVDGYNGLAAVVSGLIFAGFAYVSYYLGDRLLLVTCVSMIGAIGGFLIWNYPRGMIFLGDGGAYFIGYMMGVVSILILARHPGVSAWFPLLLCFYPVFETLFSIYRKGILRRQSPGVPDGVHLHMLIYKRLVRWVEAGPRSKRVQTQRNALTSPYLWVFSSLAGVPAVLFWQNQPVLIGFTALFSILYVLLYRALVLFKMPRWMVLKKRR
ncbi:MAG: glycosyl transferase [Burkholderiaceae bacterium]|nr:MAG: glycosyl transferase [Burkholderiaceae bacterium]